MKAQTIADFVLALALATAAWFAIGVAGECVERHRQQPDPATVCLPRAAYDEMQLRALDAERRLARLGADIAAEKTRIGGRGVGR